MNYDICILTFVAVGLFGLVFHIFSQLISNMNIKEAFRNEIIFKTLLYHLPFVSLLIGSGLTIAFSPEIRIVGILLFISSGLSYDGKISKESHHIDIVISLVSAALSIVILVNI